MSSSITTIPMSAIRSSTGSNNHVTTPTVGGSTDDTADSLRTVELVFSNRDVYTFMAMQYFIDRCEDEDERGTATFAVINPRSSTDRCIVPLAIGTGEIDFHDDSIFYRIDTDETGESRTMYLRGPDRGVLFDFVDEALDAYEAFVMT